MDFSLSTEQNELRELTNRILTDQVTNESQKAAAASEHGLDLGLWRTLADAGIVVAPDNRQAASLAAAVLRRAS